MRSSKDGSVCAWRVDLQVNGRDVESESMKSAVGGLTGSPRANGKLAVSWWVSYKRNRSHTSIRVVGGLAY